jgi:antitoxin (DNA-binding transcriptional repressor) of toxin-antitoxin stability system
VTPSPSACCRRSMPPAATPNCWRDQRQVAGSSLASRLSSRSEYHKVQARRLVRVYHLTRVKYAYGKPAECWLASERTDACREMMTISDLAAETAPAVSAPAHEAARGQVIYITEHGQRIAAIVPAELAAVLERLNADQLDALAEAMSGAPELEDLAELIEDLADRAAVLESRADPGPGTPWEVLKAEAGL